MLRYKTKTRPGLVALYDIRPGNGAGQFLQPQSPHGARSTWKMAIEMEQEADIITLHICYSLFAATFLDASHPLVVSSD